jgi:NAD(P) transhydrogenase beta subunit
LPGAVKSGGGTPPPAGSAVAFGKLHGLLASAPMNLPGKNLINIGLAGGTLASGAAFLTTGDPALGLAALGATTALGGVMGAHMTASIGGARSRSHPQCPFYSLSACLPACLPARAFGGTRAPPVPFFYLSVCLSVCLSLPACLPGIARARAQCPSPGFLGHALPMSNASIETERRVGRVSSGQRNLLPQCCR